jgi:hypothetical protein
VARRRFGALIEYFRLSVRLAPVDSFLPSAVKTRNLRDEISRALRPPWIQMRDAPFFLQEFVDQYEGRYHDFQLPLPMRLV